MTRSLAQPCGLELEELLPQRLVAKEDKARSGDRFPLLQINWLWVAVPTGQQSLLHLPAQSL